MKYEMPRDVRCREPAPLAPTGPDGVIFAAYAKIVAHALLVGPLTPDQAAARRKEITNSERASARARMTCITRPARTLEGVLLKLRYALAGEIIDDEGHIYDNPALVFSAVRDIEEMLNQRRRGAGKELVVKREGHR